MTFHIAQVRKIREKDRGERIPFTKWVTKVLFILPTMMTILFVIDLVYMLISLFSKLVLFLIKILTLNRFDLLSNYDDAADKTFQKWLNMCYMDIQGFRTQRTILQLQLESIP